MSILTVKPSKGLCFRTVALQNLGLEWKMHTIRADWWFIANVIAFDMSCMNLDGPLLGISYARPSLCSVRVWSGPENSKALVPHWVALTRCWNNIQAEIWDRTLLALAAVKWIVNAIQWPEMEWSPTVNSISMESGILLFLLTKNHFVHFFPVEGPYLLIREFRWTFGRFLLWFPVLYYIYFFEHGRVKKKATLSFHFQEILRSFLSVPYFDSTLVACILLRLFAPFKQLSNKSTHVWDCWGILLARAGIFLHFPSQSVPAGSLTGKLHTSSRTFGLQLVILPRLIDWSSQFEWSSVAPK